jgi:hypothetical protein
MFLRNLLDEKIKLFTKTMCFITDQNNSIVSQSISKDYNYDLLNQIHKITAQLTSSFLETVENDKINYLLMSSYKGFTIIMKYLNITEFNLTNLVCVSESLNNDALVQLANQCGIFIEKIETSY